MRSTDNSVSHTLVAAVVFLIGLSLVGASPTTAAAEKSASALYDEAVAAEKKLASSKNLKRKKTSGTESLDVTIKSC